MKINISEPDGPYSCNLDTGIMDVKILDAFLGVKFETKEGETLAVSMRDGGFELNYSGNFDDHGFRYGWIDLKNGILERRGV